MCSYQVAAEYGGTLAKAFAAGGAKPLKLSSELDAAADDRDNAVADPAAMADIPRHGRCATVFKFVVGLCHDRCVDFEPPRLRTQPSLTPHSGQAATGPAAAEGEDTVKEDEAAARAVEEAEVKVAAKAALEAEIAETKAAIDELRPKLVETQAKAAAAEAEDTAASGTAGAATEATALAAQQSELAELEHSLEEAVAKFVALDGASAGKKCCAGKLDTEEQKQAKAAKAKTKAAAETAPPKTRKDDAQRATAAGGTEDKAAAGDKRAGKKKCCAGKPDAEERQPPAVVAAARATKAKVQSAVMLRGPVTQRQAVVAVDAEVCEHLDSILHANGFTDGPTSEVGTSTFEPSTAWHSVALHYHMLEH